MTNQQATTTKKLREFIIEIVNTKKPETTITIVKIVQQRYPTPDEEIKAILLQLEAEDIIHFNKKISSPPSTLTAYMFSQNSIWFWMTIIIANATTLAIFLIPENAYSLVYLRQILGIIFVGFLPGHVFIKTLYQNKVPIATPSENLDTIEHIAISFGLSIALTAIIGLILNFAPWGIRLIPITLSLLGFTMFFATTGLLREYQTKAKLQD